MKFLEDDKIKLRAVEPEDSDNMLEIECDSRQWRENGMMAPYSRHNLRSYAENYDADPIRSGQLRLIIEEKETEDLLGLIDLYDISCINRTAFVGIYIIDKYRRNGHAVRALKLVENYASQLLNLRILGVKVSSRNHASRLLFEKTGYSQVGNLPDWLLSGHECYNLHVYIKKL